MKRIGTAFFMAWGNFLNIPCPVKKWDPKLNKHMLVFLPIIGAVVSALMILLIYGINYIGCSALLKGLMAFVAFFLITGFIHWDGLLDVSDAIFSRKSVEDKQKILKDSKIGAFAVLSAGICLIGYYACFSTIFVNISNANAVSGVVIKLLPMAWIFILSRWIAGLNVMTNTPMSVSQYAKNVQEDKVGKLVMASCMIIIVLAIIYLFVRLSLITLDFTNDRNAMIVCVVTILSTFLTGYFCKRSLGGMNGDVAGSAIVVGDLCGLFAMAIL